MKTIVSLSVLALSLLAIPVSATADPFFFSTGNVTDAMGMASRPESTGRIEIEAADDFVLTSETILRGGTFTGLLQGATTANIGQVVLEIYRVFPNDSTVARTSGPPLFSTSQVPTRVNSPSDVAHDDIDAGPALSFTTLVIAPTFSTLNSVLNGIFPMPNQRTMGEGPITGQEVQFTFTLNQGLDLPADHYFFVPQVQIINSDGEFFWLSGTRPIMPPGTSFPAGFTDLQAWIRNGNIDPDWLRVGTDIVGGPTPPTFNGAFSLTGDQVPEPSTLSLTLLGLGSIGLLKKLRAKPW
jgi:hypothetical protein